MRFSTPRTPRATRLTVLLLTCAWSLITISGCSERSSSDAANPAGTIVATDPAAAWRQPLFDGLGNVNLTITTNSEQAQSYFNQGLALAFAFNHAAADFAFTEATVYDPDCAMCYWGSALVLGPNVNADMQPDNAPRAVILATRAKNLATSATAKEQALIGALQTRYRAEEPADRTTLNADYAAAMQRVAAAYPDDANIIALAAESLMDEHPWDFWDAAGEARDWTARITATIEQALAIDPNHIGAIHLYIHAVEQSNDPARAEPYADRLAELAPTAGHLVHMPAHIYMRVGRYHDSTLTNMRATVADNAFVQACRSNSPIYLAGYMPHNWHFGWVTAAIEGWREKAYELADGTAASLTDELLRTPGMEVAQHFLMQPTFARLRFSDWDTLLQQPAPAADLLYARGVWHYGRAHALLAKGELDAAAVEHHKLNELRLDPAVQAMRFFNREGAPALLAVADRVLQGELANHRGEQAKALAHLQAAVAMEDALPYNEPPDWFFPVRHLLGELQLAMQDPVAAEATYRADLDVMPENGWALRGLVNALEAQNRSADALAAKQRFDTAWQHADVAIERSRI